VLHAAVTPNAAIARLPDEKRWMNSLRLSGADLTIRET
jgi:hypothetical protein